MKPTADLYSNFRFFWIIGFELKGPSIGTWGTGYSSETNIEYAPLLDFIHTVGQFSLEIKLDRDQCQGLVEPGLDFNDLGNDLAFSTIKTDLTRRDMDGDFDKGLHAQRANPYSRVIRIYFSAQDDGSLVSLCVDSQPDFSLPTGENGPVKRGYCTASTWLDIFYLEGLIAPVEELKGVLNDLPFFDLSKIEFSLL
jgi:hypothetical protein